MLTRIICPALLFVLSCREPKTVVEPCSIAHRGLDLLKSLDLFKSMYLPKRVLLRKYGYTGCRAFETASLSVLALQSMSFSWSNHTTYEGNSTV